MTLTLASRHGRSPPLLHSMASSSHQPPLPSLHPPSPIATLLILLSACAVPLLALSSSGLIPSSLPLAACSLWDSLVGLSTSFPFSFFLLNSLIVALICLSGFFDPPSRRHESDGSQDGHMHRRDYASAAHNALQESLALNQFYEMQAPSPSDLGFLESSTFDIVVDETPGTEQAHDDDEGEKVSGKKPSESFGNPSTTRNGECSNQTTYPTDFPNASSTSNPDGVETIVIASSMANHPLMKLAAKAASADNEPAADFHPDIIPDADKAIDTKDVQVCEYGHHGQESETANASERVSERGKNIVEDDDDADARSDALSNADRDDGGGQHEFRQSNPITSSASKVQQDQAMTTRPMLRAEVDDGKGTMGEDETAMAKDADEEDAEERAGGSGQGEGQGQGGREEEQMMSREELNERASAFISAFRRKLISTSTIADD